MLTARCLGGAGEFCWYRTLRGGSDAVRVSSVDVARVMPVLSVYITLRIGAGTPCSAWPGIGARFKFHRGTLATGLLRGGACHHGYEGGGGAFHFGGPRSRFGRGIAFVGGRRPGVADRCLRSSCSRSCANVGRAGGGGRCS